MFGPVDSAPSWRKTRRSEARNGPAPAPAPAPAPEALQVDRGSLPKLVSRRHSAPGRRLERTTRSPSRHDDTDPNNRDMDACEIASILAKELWFHQLVNLDGLNSGVPTRTTPTLTPTTLRSIEQTFIELQCQTEHTNQAGFVPPPVAPNILGVSQTIGFAGGSFRVSPGPGSSSGSVDSAPSPSPANSPAPSTAAPVRRRGMGGRRPAHVQPYVSPEEEERRSVRRERNKMAAARCRKRRLDHTNELEEETKGLERKKQTLQEEIRQLEQDRTELEFILETHKICCRMQATRRTNSPPDVKPAFQTLLASENKNIVYSLEDDCPVKVKEEVPDNSSTCIDNDVFTSPQTNNKRIMLASANPQVVTPMSNTSHNNFKPNRPNFLNVPLSLTPSQTIGLKNNGNLNEIAGVAITTPSNGIPFNFESLMEGGTGLTPVQPCATQQQKSQPEIGSPETVTSTKLVSL